MSEDLKPCPWCQCDNELVIHQEFDAAEWARFGVWCSNCAVTGPRAESEEEAKRLWNGRADEIEAWNTRATEASDE